MPKTKIDRASRRLHFTTRSVAVLHAVSVLVVLQGCNPGGDNPQSQQDSVEVIETDGQRFMRYASNALNSAHFDLSLAFVDSAKAVGAPRQDISFMHGRVMFELGRMKDARSDYENVVRLDPEYEGVWQNLGNIAFREKKYREALKHFKRQAALIDDEPRPQHAVGGAYKELGIADSSRMSFESAVELDSTYAPAHFSLAEWHEVDGDFAKALIYARRANRILPSLKYQQKIGQLLLREGQLADAVEQLTPVVERQPWNYSALFSLGQAQQRLGDESGEKNIRRSEELRKLNAAVELAESLASSSPLDSNRQIRYANALRRSGRLAEALRAYQTAYLLSPGNLDLQNNLATMYVQTGQPNEALYRYAAILQTDSTYAESWLNIGLLYKRGGKDQEAARAFAAARRHGRGNANILNALARIEAAQ